MGYITKCTFLKKTKYQEKSLNVEYKPKKKSKNKIDIFKITVLLIYYVKAERVQLYLIARLVFTDEKLAQTNDCFTF